VSARDFQPRELVEVVLCRRDGAGGYPWTWCQDAVHTVLGVDGKPVTGEEVRTGFEGSVAVRVRITRTITPVEPHDDADDLAKLLRAMASSTTGPSTTRPPSTTAPPTTTSTTVPDAGGSFDCSRVPRSCAIVIRAVQDPRRAAVLPYSVRPG
jgi:hypothetical protein